MHGSLDCLRLHWIDTIRWCGHVHCLRGSCKQLPWKQHNVLKSPSMLHTKKTAPAQTDWVVGERFVRRTLALMHVCCVCVLCCVCVRCKEDIECTLCLCLFFASGWWAHTCEFCASYALHHQLERPTNFIRRWSKACARVRIRPVLPT